MLTKDYTEITNPETWELSKTKDIILTKKGTSQKRVLMSLERYKELKNSIKLLLKQITLDSELEDGIDWNLHIEDFKNILKNGSFKKITESHYFEKLARNWCVKDKSRKE